MEYIIIISLSIGILGSSFMWSIMKMIQDTKLDDKFLIFILSVYSFLVLWLSFSYLKEPRAIDVYKGKTTLVITYKDRVPIDSTVVWKKINN